MHSLIYWPLIWPTFQGHLGQTVKIQFWANQVAQIVIAEHRDLYSCRHRPTNEPRSHTKTRSVWPKLGRSDLIYWSKSAEKWAWTWHFQASWALSPMGFLQCNVFETVFIATPSRQSYPCYTMIMTHTSQTKISSLIFCIKTHTRHTSQLLYNDVCNLLIFTYLRRSLRC